MHSFGHNMTVCHTDRQTEIPCHYRVRACRRAIIKRQTIILQLKCQLLTLSK